MIEIITVSKDIANSTKNEDRFNYYYFVHFKINDIHMNGEYTIWGDETGWDSSFNTNDLPKVCNSFKEEEDLIVEILKEIEKEGFDLERQ